MLTRSIVRSLDYLSTNVYCLYGLITYYLQLTIDYVLQHVVKLSVKLDVFFS